MTGTLHEDIYIYDHILLNSSWNEKCFRETLQTKSKRHILYSVPFHRKSCRLRVNVNKYGRARQATDDNIIRCIHFACRITKATHTHSVPQQQFLRGSATILRLNAHCLCCSSYNWYRYITKIFLYDAEKAVIATFPFCCVGTTD